MGMKKYLKIKEYILERILNGTFVPERPIPSERDMAAEFGVTRMTVRHAVEELMYDGYLIRKKGSGTYLTREKVRKDELIAGEEKHAIRLISCRLCCDGSYGYRMLGIPEDGEEGYWRIRRVRSICMVPFAYEDIYLRESFFPQVDQSYHSIGLHEMVKEKWGKGCVLRQQQVEALLCLKTTGDLLNIAEGAPVLQIKTWFYRESDKEQMLYCRSYHPGDTYTFQSHLKKVK